MAWLLTSRKNPGTHWVGVWVGLRASFTFLRREKSYKPTGIQIPDDPGYNVVTVLTMLSWLLLHACSGR
jgi:hypothetical protein